MSAETLLTLHTGGYVSPARDTTGLNQLTAVHTRGGGTVRLPGGTGGQELTDNVVLSAGRTGSG